MNDRDIAALETWFSMVERCFADLAVEFARHDRQAALSALLDLQLRSLSYIAEFNLDTSVGDKSGALARRMKVLIERATAEIGKSLH